MTCIPTLLSGTLLLVSVFIAFLLQKCKTPWWKNTHETSVLHAEDFYVKFAEYKTYLDYSFIPEKYYGRPLSVSGTNGLLYELLHSAYDPRLMPALWGNSILQQLDRDSYSPITLPFSWESLVGHELGQLDFENHLSYDTFCKRAGFEQENCPFARYSESQTERGLEFIVSGPIDIPMTEKGRKMVGVNFLLNAAPNPERLCLLGMGPNYTALMVPFNTRPENAFELLVELYLASNGESYNISLAAIAGNLRARLASTGTGEHGSVSIDDRFRLISSTSAPVLSKSDFVLELDQLSLEDTAGSSERNDNKTNKETIQMSPQMPENYAKYFHEAALINTEQGGHYDWRFFDKIVVSEYDKKAVFHRMARAWLRFAHSAGLKTWLAHGTLLGWYWNGLSLPWDNDIDVQMTMASLVRLSKGFNQTLVFDLTDEGYGQEMGSYLVDVNPAFCSRTKGNGNNTIDARFIDTQTGLYVDITALAFTEAAHSISLKLKESSELNQLLHSRFLEEANSHTVVKEELYSKLSASRQNLCKNSILFNCKDEHFYTFDELSALKTTLFEGITAFVPPSYKTILSREYRKGLHNLQFADHTFRPVLDIWIPSKVCKGDTLGNSCSDQPTLLEAKHTRYLTGEHRRSMNSRTFEEPLDLGPIRVDSWTIERLQRVEEILGRKL